VLRWPMISNVVQGLDVIMEDPMCLYPLQSTLGRLYDPAYRPWIDIQSGLCRIPFIALGVLNEMMISVGRRPRYIHDGAWVTGLGGALLTGNG